MLQQTGGEGLQFWLHHRELVAEVQLLAAAHNLWEMPDKKAQSFHKTVQKNGADVYTFAVIETTE